MLRSREVMPTHVLDHSQNLGDFTGELVTAATLNQHVRDQLNFVYPMVKNGYVGNAESTSSTTYVDLTTPGPTVTLDTGTSVLVLMTAEISASGGFNYMSVAVSGASTVAASDNHALVDADSATTGFTDRQTAAYPISGLTAGSNTFTAKYKTSGVSASFGLRSLTVVKL
jgi:hypothetical protein